jgi:hypothetical protein
MRTYVTKWKSATVAVKSFDRIKRNVNTSEQRWHWEGHMSLRKNRLRKSSWSSPHKLTNQLLRIFFIQQFVAIQLIKNSLLLWNPMFHYSINKKNSWIPLTQFSPHHMSENHFSIIFPYMPIYRNGLWPWSLTVNLLHTFSTSYNQ